MSEALQHGPPFPEGIVQNLINVLDPDKQLLLYDAGIGNEEAIFCSYGNSEHSPEERKQLSYYHGTSLDRQARILIFRVHEGNGSQSSVEWYGHTEHAENPFGGCSSEDLNRKLEKAAKLHWIEVQDFLEQAVYDPKLT